MKGIVVTFLPHHEYPLQDVPGSKDGNKTGRGRQPAAVKPDPKAHPGSQPGQPAKSLAVPAQAIVPGVNIGRKKLVVVDRQDTLDKGQAESDQENKGEPGYNRYPYGQPEQF